ncbi:hypothetical protein [Phaeacidiphilus oryzae]|uniref:hypothetical protein n=1 Tax=Phaeacidiphilus oryzae TaxID=348818 RepID=UPI0007C6E86E|nr:hypothetical protein [Phaeacidiphilus oryzae]
MWSDLIGVYQRHIAEPGKQPLFLLLVGFIGSFLFIRFSVRMIRRGVRWWPGNVTPGGLHIHHVVFGMFFLLVSGIGTFATVGTHPWIDAFAGFFGIGCGLVLDEFALLLHLEDVYWSDQGRKSVDAVIIGIVFTGLLLVGYLPLGYTPGGSGSRGHWGLIGIISLNGACAVLSLLKGKLWTGLIGIMVPGVSWVGAVRLARPFSPWARWVYTRHPRLYGRARRREARWHRRADAVREWVFDVIAGKPTPGATAVQQVTHRVAERMAARMAAHLAHSRARHLARMAARHRLGSTEWPGAVGGGAGLSGGSAFAASARYGPNRPTARRTAVARRRAGGGTGAGPGGGAGLGAVRRWRTLAAAHASSPAAGGARRTAAARRRIAVTAGRTRRGR